ncbi:MAG: AAA family ATPase [Acidobacteria bacterium]|nr:AAA family ATPase [Acidobacteriota bacterium]
MDTETSSPLHLPSLKICGFRGFDRLTIPCLGSVTLLAGRNGVGKTTVLDAVRLFAARGRGSELSTLLKEREELVGYRGLGPVTEPVPDFAALFHGRGEDGATTIAIGPGPDEDDLRLTVSPPEEWSREEAELVPDPPRDVRVEALRVTYGGSDKFVPGLVGHDGRSNPLGVLLRERGRRDESDWPAPITCESLGPGLPDKDDLGLGWSGIALTEAEDFLVEALKLVLDAGVERVSVVGGGGTGAGSRLSRGVIVKLRDHARPVPLKSLGDGAARLFGAALALTHSRKGLLLIDEAENGLHYTVHEDFWRMVLGTAREGGVQVLATTHSWDCIVGFARAATECADTDGVLVRLEPGGDGCRAVVYSEDELQVAAEQRIEVR